MHGGFARVAKPPPRGSIKAPDFGTPGQAQTKRVALAQHFPFMFCAMSGPCYPFNQAEARKYVLVRRKVAHQTCAPTRPAGRKGLLDPQEKKCEHFVEAALGHPRL